LFGFSVQIAFALLWDEIDRIDSASLMVIGRQTEVLVSGSKIRIPITPNANKPKKHSGR